MVATSKLKSITLSDLYFPCLHTWLKVNFMIKCWAFAFSTSFPFHPIPLCLYVPNVRLHWRRYPQLHIRQVWYETRPACLFSLQTNGLQKMRWFCCSYIWHAVILFRRKHILILCKIIYEINKFQFFILTPNKVYIHSFIHFVYTCLYDVTISVHLYTFNSWIYYTVMLPMC